MSHSEKSGEKLVVVGCGNMGSAIVESLLRQNIYQAGNITIVEKIQNPSTEAFQKQNIPVLRSVGDYSGVMELVLLAVKPQNSAETLKQLAPKTDGNSLVLSIMAGISIAKLEAELKPAQIIRCMPNTPCAIGMGMSVFCGNDKVSQASIEIAEAIFNSFGKAFAVTDELMIDAATAISGSGPAYLFYLAESMKEGAKQLGFSEEQAGMLATQTVLGASSLMDVTGESPESLRQKVTSPGGTTEAALRYFNDNQLKKTLIEGIKKAYDRSIELGKL